MRKTWNMSEDTMIDNLEETLKIQSVSGNEDKMNKFIIDHIKYVNEHVKDVTIVTEQQAGGTNIYVTKGKADVYPCVVAHTDTVHDFVEGYCVTVFLALSSFAAQRKPRRATRKRLFCIGSRCPLIQPFGVSLP